MPVAQGGRVPTIATNTPRRAILLVAGIGSRLGKLTTEVPKCLVEVNGISILENALAHLEQAGVSDTVLVVGYRDDLIRARIGDAFGRMRVAYRANQEFRTTSTSRSLWLGLADVEDDVLVLEGDVFFERSVLERFLALPAVDATLVEPWRPGLDGSVVQRGPDGVVRAWLHKKEQPPGFSLNGTCKTVNVHRFSAAFVRQWLRPALQAQVSADGGREPIETMFAAMVRDGARIHAADAAGRWVEIDDETDLRSAVALFGGAAR
jgi:NDP-sugar pyrophosphorylase family protein